MPATIALAAAAPRTGPPAAAPARQTAGAAEGFALHLAASRPAAEGKAEDAGAGEAAVAAPPDGSAAGPLDAVAAGTEPPEDDAPAAAEDWGGSGAALASGEPLPLPVEVGPWGDLAGVSTAGPATAAPKGEKAQEAEAIASPLSADAEAPGVAGRDAGLAAPAPLRGDPAPGRRRNSESAMPDAAAPVAAAALAAAGPGADATDLAGRPGGAGEALPVAGTPPAGMLTGVAAAGGGDGAMQGGVMPPAPLPGAGSAAGAPQAGSGGAAAEGAAEAAAAPTDGAAGAIAAAGRRGDAAVQGPEVANPTPPAGWISEAGHDPLRAAAMPTALPGAGEAAARRAAVPVEPVATAADGVLAAAEPGASATVDTVPAAEAAASAAMDTVAAAEPVGKAVASLPEAAGKAATPLSTPANAGANAGNDPAAQPLAAVDRMPASGRPAASTAAAETGPPPTGSTAPGASHRPAAPAAWPGGTAVPSPAAGAERPGEHRFDERPPTAPAMPADPRTRTAQGVSGPAFVAGGVLAPPIPGAVPDHDPPAPPAVGGDRPDGAAPDPTGAVIAPGLTLAPAPQGRGHGEAAAVAAQVTRAVVRFHDGKADIRLDPVELGGLTLTVSRRDGVTVIHLAADRPETAELMRRHADLLLGDLEANGVSGARLDFGDGGRREGGAAEHRQPAAAPRDPVPALTVPRPPAAPPPASPPGARRLDIRF